MDLPFLMFGVGLAIAMAFASLTVTAYPDRRLARGALILFANWLAGTVFALATQVTDGWWFNLLLDAVSAALILRPAPAVRWQYALAVTYGIQFLGHLYYGWMRLSGEAAPWPYYSWLTAIAWFQLLLIGCWSLDVWRKGAAAARATRKANGGDPR